MKHDETSEKGKSNSTSKSQKDKAKKDREVVVDFHFQDSSGNALPGRCSAVLFDDPLTSRRLSPPLFGFEDWKFSSSPSLAVLLIKDCKRRMTQVRREPNLDVDL